MIVYLDDKRHQFALIANKIQHAFAGFPLLAIGLEKLSHGEDLPIAAAETAIAVLVLGTFVLELREAVRHTKHGGAHGRPKAGWFDLAAGVLLIYEAFHGAHDKPGYLRPQFFNGLIVIALGLLHTRISRGAAKRRYIRVDEDGVEYRMPFRGWSIPWSEIASIELGHKKVVFVRTNGKRRKVNLGRLHNRDAVRGAIAERPEAAGLLGG